MSGNPPPAVQRLGTAVLLQGPAVGHVLGLLDQGIRFAERENGWSRTAAEIKLLAVFTAAATGQSLQIKSDVGPDSADIDVPVQPLLPNDPLTTAEVAQMLGCTTRHVTRRAATLGGRRSVGGQWIFTRCVVEAAVAETTEEETA